MDDLLASVRQFSRRYALFAPGAIVVVGVSGGPDSLCLLHLLRRLAPELGLWLHVAHLDHGLRGADSAADAAFVAGLAAEWGLPCTVGRVDVAAIAEEAGLSLEEAARQARYRFLAEVAERVCRRIEDSALAPGTGPGSGRVASLSEQTSAPIIAVGHNADDQAETVLMHFLRGSGVAGLRGMLPRAPLAQYRMEGGSGSMQMSGYVTPEGHVADEPEGVVPSPYHPITLSDLWLVRPLLATSRADVEAYCAAHGLQPRFDRSNEDTTFFRNRLRHELLPILESYNPQIRAVLAHTAEVLAGDYEVLRAVGKEAWARVCGVRGFAKGGYGLSAECDSNLLKTQIRPHVEYDLAGWRALPLGLQRATIREAIHRLRRSLRNINWEHVEAAVWLAREGTTGQKATLAAGLELEIGYMTLRIADEGASWPADVPQITTRIRLNAPGTTSLPGGWQAVVERLGRADLLVDFAANRDPWTAYLDADVTGPELSLRPRQSGDRFQPQGLGGHSTAITEFMINAKMPRDDRAGWPLLIGVFGIAWVCGLRVDERAVVRPATRTVWRVAFVSRCKVTG